jgi:hypothetical protein
VQHYLDGIGEGEGHNIPRFDTGADKLGGGFIDGSMKAGVGELRAAGGDDGGMLAMPVS